MWQAFDSAYAFLAVSGLIYPDSLLMSSPLYSQFTAIPGASGWPRRPPTEPDNYHLYPTSAVENPARSASPYPVGSSPLAFLIGVAGTPAPGVWTVAQSIWLQVVQRVMDSQSPNLDLDADRGFGHPCWQVAPGTSINDNPVQVQDLAYAQM